MERPRKTMAVLTVCAFTVRGESAFHSPGGWNMYTCILFHMKLYFFRFFSMLFKINNANKSPPLLLKSSNITGGKVTLNRGHCAPKCQSELESIWKLALVMWHLLGLWHLLLCSCVHSSPICFPHLSELILTDLDPPRRVTWPVQATPSKCITRGLQVCCEDQLHAVPYALDSWVEAVQETWLPFPLWGHEVLSVCPVYLNWGHPDLSISF